MHRRELLGRGAAALAATVPAAGVLGPGDASGGGRRGTDGAAALAEGYEPLGSVDLDGTKEIVLSPDGRTAYLATTTGYATVDLSEPADPAILADRREPLADRDDGPLELIQDVSLDGDRLLVAGPAHPHPGVSGALLVDVSDPAAPEPVAFHETDFPIHNCVLRGDHAYLTSHGIAGNPLVIVEMGNDGPAEVARWSPLDREPAWGDVAGALRPLHDLWVGDGLVCLAYWDVGTWLVDVSDPAAPAFLSRIGGRSPEELAAVDERRSIRREALAPPGNHHSVQVAGDLMVVGRESWAVRDGEEFGGGPSGLRLWDVSDPTAPERLSAIDPPPTPEPTRSGIWTTAHNFGLAGDTLYSAWYQGGVKRHDVGDPAAPSEETWWCDPERARFWAAVPAVTGADGFFVASSMGTDEASAGLYTFPDAAGTRTDETIRESTPSPSIPSTPTATPSPSPTGERGPEPKPEVTAPGFGVGAALAALGASAWRRLRRGRRGR